MSGPASSSAARCSRARRRGPPRWRWVAAGLGLAGGVWAAANVLKPMLGPEEAPLAPWHVAGLPKQAKPFTQFRVVTVDGERALRVEADQSYGNLVQAVAPGTAAHSLAWRWRVDEANTKADITRKDGDDTPVKVCAFFDEPLTAVPFVERQLLRVARGMSNEPLPAASVCYLWDNRLPPGSSGINAFTRRIRYVVLRGPEAALHRWQVERRDVVADFMRLFGDETDTVPPLMGIGVGGDADNTHAHSVAHVADVTLE